MSDQAIPDHVIPEPGTDEAARRRQSFGAWADDYDRYRPGYPVGMFGYLLDQLPAAAVPPRVVDIGAGTGQLSKGFIAAGAAVTAVEPDPRMREILTGTPGLTAALAGSAEELPLPDASADLIVGGQMWHWVDPARAVPEIGRVLAPGGVLAIIWNLRDDRVPWVRAMEQYVELPDSYKWFRTHEVPVLSEPFGQMHLREFSYAQPSDPESLVGLVGTFSHVGLSGRKDEIMAGVAELTRTNPDLAGRETFDIPYVCKVFTAVRPGV